MRSPGGLTLAVAILLAGGDAFSAQEQLAVEARSAPDTTRNTGAPSSGEADVAGRVILASSYGLVCHATSSREDQPANTNALAAALAAAAERRVPVLLPAGVCGFEPFTIPPGVKLMGAGQERTTLEASPSTGGAYVTMSSNSTLQDLTINGNKDAQTVGACGVFGGQIRDAVIEDVTITNVLGMGDCFQDSAHIVHVRETVTHTRRPSELTHTTANGKNGSGFWTASYTQSSFFYDGGSQYIDCVATDNDLDGLEFGSHNTTIIGGHFDHNGRFTDVSVEDREHGTHTKILGGALGAAGIYFAPGTGKPGTAPSAGTNTIISGVSAYANTESGFDVGLGQGSIVVNNMAYDNGTLGFLMNGYQGAGSYSLIGNQAFDNGRTTFEEWLRANPGYMLRAGFAFTGSQSHVSATGNFAFDHRSVDGTQQWGFYAETGIAALGTPLFDHFILTANRLGDNAVGASNFDGLSVAMSPHVTDFKSVP